MHPAHASIYASHSTTTPIQPQPSLRLPRSPPINPPLPNHEPPLSPPRLPPPLQQPRPHILRPPLLPGRHPRIPRLHNPVHRVPHPLIPRRPAPLLLPPPPLSGRRIPLLLLGLGVRVEELLREERRRGIEAPGRVVRGGYGLDLGPRRRSVLVLVLILGLRGGGLLLLGVDLRFPGLRLLLQPEVALLALLPEAVRLAANR